LEGIKIVGADIVEVATPYDTNAQVTAIAAADIMYEGKPSNLCLKHPQSDNLFLKNSFLQSHEPDGQEAVERPRISQFLMQVDSRVVVNCVVIQEIVSILDHKLCFFTYVWFKYNLLSAAVMTPYIEPCM
jgi:Arginase family